jgi:molecular chaperone GrpE (heat shock protein)
MTKNEFDLEGFRTHLQQLQKELSEGVNQDPEYQGEVDEIISALKRLTQELKDKKYQQVLPDLFKVIEFLDMVEDEYEEEEEEE